jgi:hypothetical protein
LVALLFTKHAALIDWTNFIAGGHFYDCHYAFMLKAKDKHAMFNSDYACSSDGFHHIKARCSVSILEDRVLAVFVILAMPYVVYDHTRFVVVGIILKLLLGMPVFCLLRQMMIKSFL